MAAMGFFFPGALALFAVTPLLLIAYLTRKRPPRVRVSSVLAYRAMGAPRSSRLGGWPRLDWLFIVELLILCLAVLAIAGPYEIRENRSFAVVLDNSAAMQAKTPTGPTRYAAGIAWLSDALAQHHFPAHVTLYVTAPQPHQLGAAFGSFSSARQALSSVKLTDAPTDPGALKDLLSGLLADPHLNGIYYTGAYSIAPPMPSRLIARSFDAPLANFALGSFTLRRDSFGTPTLHGHAAIANFSNLSQTLTVTVTAGSKRLARVQTQLGPNELGAVDFPSLRLADSYQVHLGPGDGFALDNIAYAVSGAVRSISVLFVSPAPDDANGLAHLPGVKLITRQPDKYTPADLASADVAIFQYGVPKELPSVNTLLVMPPPGDPVFDFSVTPASHISISGWNTTDPLTDAVNSRLLNPRAGEFFGVHRWLQPIASGPGGGLIMRGTRAGHRFVATGFNPFPYLGKQNLPMSILTLNMLSYLAGLGFDSGGFRTGQKWQVPVGIEKIVTPSARTEPVTAGGTFFANEQGVYQLVASGGAKSLRAVNLDDLGVSDFAHVPVLRLEAGGTPAEPNAVEKAPLTPDLLYAILILGIIEALVVYRRRRVMTEAV
ncbi:MAG: BatA domain-containing protein [Candidatus Binataceae bacterium]|nr:BatA domain-containing protein [Candidatus Binataceae bacterium]